MKKALLLFAAVAFLCNVLISQVNVTFRVDMSQQTLSGNGIHLAGSFQGWDTSANEMNDDGDGIYSTTVALQPGTYEFKYVNGDAWGSDENVPQECGVSNGNGGYNRTVNVAGAGPVILDAVCYEECAECITQPGPVSVTLKVDMSTQTVSPDGVHIAGNFQGWNAGSTLMTLIGNGIYEYTLETTEGFELLYKFINGSDWPGQESVPSECGVSDGFGGYNRGITVGSADLNLGAVCFSECAACAGTEEPLMVQVNIRVDMTNETVDPNGVHIVGSFQNWTTPGPVMSPIGNNIYEHIMEVAENTSFEYRFLNGTDFSASETVPSECGVDDGFGGYNRSITLGTNDLIADTVCFSSCTNCVIVPEPLQVSITFQVNMQDETVSADGVHIAGNFQGWNTSASELTDTDADGVYEFTTLVDTNYTVLYKFINGNAWENAETVPSTCGADDLSGGYNRSFNVEETDATIDAVCFSSCEDCEPIVEPVYVDITFQVNMQDETVSADGVHIAGNFQGWDAGSSEMTDTNADGIYEYTAQVEINSTVEYKFINGNDWPASEAVPVSCGVDDGNGGQNRAFDVEESDVTIDAVCFSSCEDCEPIVEPVYIDVTFQVNMQNETVSADGVHIAGNFQGWDAGSSEMTDVDADGIYEYTAQVEINSTVEYKFINGNTWPSSETIPSSCGVDDGNGGQNRAFDVEETDVTIDAVCFSSCEDCEPIVEPVYVDVSFRVNMENQVVSANGVHIAGSFQGWDAGSSEMTDANADGIYEYTAQVEINSTVEYKFINGNDWPSSEAVPALCGVDDGNGGQNRSVPVSTSDMILNVFCFGECLNCNVEVELVNVTFLVNMNNETISPNGVHLVGNFQGWDAGLTEMNDADDDGIYEYTYGVPSNENVYFKFINGDSFDNQEIVLSECGENDGFGGYNRLLEVNDLDETFGPVCFGECEDCLVDDSLDVTFRVNMTQETIDANGVFVNAWINDATESVYYEMTDNDADGVYEYTATVHNNQFIYYRYMNGEGLAANEVIPAECGVQGEQPLLFREVELEEDDMTLGLVCFGECSNCFTGATNMITLLVNMQNETVSADGVHVAGNFQGWDPSTSEMTDNNADGIYEITFESDEWANLSFKFINGDEWGSQEIVPETCGLPDGNGGYNRLLETGGIDFTFGPVCFGECANCTPVSETVNVTFLVNMSSQVVSENGVHIAGSFQGWDPATSLMTDNDEDGIYEYTAEVPVNSEILFKFINGNTWDPGQESVPGDCGVNDGFGAFNRNINVLESDVVFGPVCFSDCTDCIPIMPVLVTIRVDMSNETVSPDGVYVAGSFNGWDATATQMSLYEPNHYQAVVVVNAGQTVNYKFLNGPDWTAVEAVPIACGQDDGDGNINRYFIAQTNETLDLICFSECSACVIVPMIDLTLTVDMGNLTVNAGGVFVAGTFNGFSATATQMTLQSGAVYSTTVSVPANTMVNFKYLNGPDFANVETVPFECGADDGFGGYNRTITVDESEVSLPEVCFSSCVDCPVGVDEISNDTFSIYPNPSSGQFTVKLNNANQSFIKVFDVKGKLVVNERTGSSGIFNVNTSGWESGLYHVVIPGVGQRTISVM